MKKLFISYYTKGDSRKVQTLKNAIEKDGSLIEQLKIIVIAQRREPLKQLSQKVQDGIKESDFFVPILTKKSIHTQWVNQEIGFAKAEERIFLPIVEENVKDDLKGFIHRECELFLFSHSNRSKTLKKCCEDLIKCIKDKYLKNQNFIQLPSKVSTGSRHFY